MTRCALEIACVERVDGILKIEIVGSSVFRTGFTEDILYQGIAFGSAACLGEQLCPFNLKDEILIIPFVYTGIIDKLINEQEGGIDLFGVFISH